MSDTVEVVLTAQIRVDGPAMCGADCPYFHPPVCLLFDCELKPSRKGNAKRPKRCRDGERALIGMKEVAERLHSHKPKKKK